MEEIVQLVIFEKKGGKIPSTDPMLVRQLAGDVSLIRKSSMIN